MANEWTVVELFGENRDGDQISYTCASGTAITKGTVCILTDPFTASAVTASHAPIAGIAAMDKSGTDFSTKISVWTNGIFNATASGAPIIAGENVQVTAYNYALKGGGYSNGAASGAEVIGYSRELTAAGDRFNVRVRL